MAEDLNDPRYRRREDPDVVCDGGGTSGTLEFGGSVTYVGYRKSTGERVSSVDGGPWLPVRARRATFAEYFARATKALANAGANANRGDWAGAMDEATKAQTYLYDFRAELEAEHVKATERAGA